MAVVRLEPPVLLVLLLLAVLFLAYANGANDNFKAVATLYGASTLTMRQSLWLATAAQVLGSVASVALATALVKAFSGKGLVPDAAVTDARFLLGVGVAAALTVWLAAVIGMPISTTHALIGGLVGAGVCLAPGDVRWAALGGRYLTPLLVSPFLAVAAAGVIYPILHLARLRLGVDDVTCLCVGRKVDPVALTRGGEFAVARSGVALTVEQQQQCEQRYTGSFVGVSAQRVVDVLHMCSGFSLGFARGLNDTPKIMALLVAAAWTGLSATSSLICIAVAMAVGGVLQSRRVAQTLSVRITEMNTGQGLVANVVASSLVIGASVMGSPVSTTHVATGAIFGIGLWTRRAHWGVVAEIIGAWVITAPVAAVLAYAIIAVSGS